MNKIEDWDIFEEVTDTIFQKPDWVVTVVTGMAVVIGLGLVLVLV